MYTSLENKITRLEYDSRVTLKSLIRLVTGESKVNDHRESKQLESEFLHVFKLSSFCKGGRGKNLN